MSPMERSLCNVFACLVILCPTMSDCAPSYSAKSITARVVDADTKKPIEGVIVLADWRLHGLGPEGGSPGLLMRLEAMTDRSGSFHVPAWGPKELVQSEWLEGTDPDILLFKDGYGFQPLREWFRPSGRLPRPPKILASSYDGNIVEMRKFDGDLHAWARHLSDWSTRLFGTAIDRCGWQDMPRTIQAQKQQSEAFQQAGIQSRTLYDDLLAFDPIMSKMGCPPLTEFMRSREHAQ